MRPLLLAWLAAGALGAPTSASGVYSLAPDDSPYANVLKTDAERFQEWISRMQNPHDCSTAKGTMSYNGYFRNLGIGAQLVSLKVGLLNALLQGSIYYFPHSQYVNPVQGQGCERQSFTCYFEAPSRCVEEELSSFKLDEHRWCALIPRRNLTRLAGLREVHSTEWYHAQLAKYLFRPNARLRAYRDDMGRRLVGFPQRSTAESRCVALHVRRTDKFTEDKRANSTGSFANFARAFKSWQQWSYEEPERPLHAFIGSEDNATFTTLPQLLLPARSEWMPSSSFVLDSATASAFKAIKDSTIRLMHTYHDFIEGARELERHMRRAKEAAKQEAYRESGFTMDEGLALTTQMLMMSECEAFIGSFSSNVGVVVHDLMLARRIDARRPFHALDINGRVYCGCGASLCLELEEEMDHHPEQTFGGLLATKRFRNEAVAAFDPVETDPL